MEVEVGFVFEGGGYGEEAAFFERGGDDLEAEGHAVGIEAAGHGEGGEADEVDGAGEAGGGEADVFIVVIDADGGLADDGGGGGSGGGDDDVDAAEEFEELIAEDAASALGVDVISGGEEAALVEEGSDIGADFEAAVLEAFHGGGGFREEDDAGGRVHGRDVGDADDFDFGSEAGG